MNLHSFSSHIDRTAVAIMNPIQQIGSRGTRQCSTKQRSRESKAASSPRGMVCPPSLPALLPASSGAVLCGELTQSTPEEGWLANQGGCTPWAGTVCHLQVPPTSYKALSWSALAATALAPERSYKGKVGRLLPKQRLSSTHVSGGNFLLKLPPVREREKGEKGPKI